MMDQIFLEYEYSKMYSDKTRQWYKIKGGYWSHLRESHMGKIVTISKNLSKIIETLQLSKF